jgi:hypothetical protein
VVVWNGTRNSGKEYSHSATWIAGWTTVQFIPTVHGACDGTVKGNIVTTESVSEGV